MQIYSGDSDSSTWYPMETVLAFMVGRYPLEKYTRCQWTRKAATLGSNEPQASEVSPVLRQSESEVIV